MKVLFRAWQLRATAALGSTGGIAAEGRATRPSTSANAPISDAISEVVGISGRAKNVHFALGNVLPRKKKEKKCNQALKSIQCFSGLENFEKLMQNSKRAWNFGWGSYTVVYRVKMMRRAWKSTMWTRQRAKVKCWKRFLYDSFFVVQA